ncbi:MAG: glycosyltransferase family 4 protein [Gemmatimonadaceae bacterium]|nr:glycosyltransferase family 4 protein [Gemmatimonadaceae bacterium]
MTRMRAARLAILASHPIQYFTPIYRLLAAHPHLEVDVFYCRDFGVRPRYDKQFGRVVRWDTEQLAGYRHRFLLNVSPISDTFNPLHAVNPGAFFRMLRGYDALWVNGYLYPSNWLAAFAGALTGTRLLMRSELRLDGERHGRWARVRDRLIRGWVARSDALLYIGAENRAAYLAYGADPRKLFFTPYSTDVDRFANAAQMPADARAVLRARWGVPPDAVVVLYVGKLTARKHPEALLRLGVPSAFPRLHVVIAGSGPMEGELSASAASLGATSVTFLGFVNQAKLPEVYGLGDIFVMPSEREPWGLVLNEAMASGLAPVVSSDVGAAADLITPDETGFVFESRAWDAMTRHVQRLAADDALRARIAEAARARSSRYSHAAAAQGVLDALAALGVLDGSDAHPVAQPAGTRG